MMGFFDLPAPLFSAADGVLGFILPAGLRLILWGITAGGLTMVFYRRLSNQEKITALKQEQKAQQQKIAIFDGDFMQLMPMIKHTLGLGFRQLGLAIVPAILASLPVLFLVAWVAGQFGYKLPEAGQTIIVTSIPPNTSLTWTPVSFAQTDENGWRLQWPKADTPASISAGENVLLTFPLEHAVAVIHKKQWWNLLFSNPLGYLPEQAPLSQLNIELQAKQFLPFGPDWLRGWMFAFFGVFLLSSLAFKFVLKID
jgi:hypothetical protein